MFFPASIRTGTFAELSDAGKCLPIAAPAALLATARAFRGDADALEQRLEETLEQLRRCAPNANAATKALLLASESGELGALLDDAARQFAEAVGGAEGSEGTLAFVQKRKPVWAQ